MKIFFNPDGSIQNIESSIIVATSHLTRTLEVIGSFASNSVVTVTLQRADNIVLGPYPMSYKGGNTWLYTFIDNDLKVAGQLGMTIRFKENGSKKEIAMAMSSATVYSALEKIIEDEGVVGAINSQLSDINSEQSTQNTRLVNLESRATKIEEKNTSQDSKINDLYSKDLSQEQAIAEIKTKVTAFEGGSFYVPVHDFKKAEPTQKELTDYAKSYHNDYPKNGLEIVNAFDDNVWRYQTETKTWIPLGKSTVSQATNDGVLGAIMGSYDYLKAYINPDGTVDINGLRQALLDFNTILQQKLDSSDNLANVKGASYDSQHSILRINRNDGSFDEIDFNLEKLPIDYDLDIENKAIIFKLEDGSQKILGLTSLFIMLSGSISDTVQVHIKDNVIHVNVLDGSINWAKLTNEISSKIQTAYDNIIINSEKANEALTRANSADSKSREAKEMAQNLENRANNGEFNGKDATLIAINGFFSLYVNDRNELICVHPAGTTSPLKLDENGNLVAYRPTIVETKGE